MSGMGIWPRVLPGSAEESAAMTIGDLKRRLARAERGNTAAALQSGYTQGATVPAVGASKVTIATLPGNLPQVDPSVQATAAAIIFWWSLTAESSNASTTQATIGLDIVSTLTQTLTLHSGVGSNPASPATFYPAAVMANGGSGTTGAVTTPYSIPLWARVLATIGSGDVTFNLTAQRAAGTGTINITKPTLFVAVL